MDIKLLHKAILSAYTINSLEQMLLFELRVKLHSIVSSSKNFNDAAFEVIQAGEREGWIDQLMDAVCRDKPNNSDVRKICGENHSDIASSASTPNRAVHDRATIEAMNEQLKSYRDNLNLIDNRLAQFVSVTDIPLQLIRDKREIEAKIADLERKLGRR